MQEFKATCQFFVLYRKSDVKMSAEWDLMKAVASLISLIIHRLQVQMNLLLGFSRFFSAKFFVNLRKNLKSVNGVR